MANNSLKNKFNKYLQNSQSSYCVISCSKKDECKNYVCKNGICNNVDAHYFNDTDSVYDFDLITGKFCKDVKVSTIGSCDGIVFLYSGEIILIEFKMGVHYDGKGNMDCKDLREKLLSSLEIIYKLCNIKDRLSYCKLNISYYVVYNENIFNANKYIDNTASKLECSEGLLYEDKFAGATSKESKLLCKFFSLDYFKKFLLKDLQVLSINEFKEIKNKLVVC